MFRGEYLFREIYDIMSDICKCVQAGKVDSSRKNKLKLDGRTFRVRMLIMLFYVPRNSFSCPESVMVNALSGCCFVTVKKYII